MMQLKQYTFRKEAALYLLLGLPTIAVVGYAIFEANQYFSFLQNGWRMQTLEFALGMLAAFSLFLRRFRFLPISLVLLAIVTGTGLLVETQLTGELDAYFWSVKFYTAALFFGTGWIAGYGFARARFFSVVWSVLLLAAMAVVVATTASLQSNMVIALYAPTLAYSFYIIYISELLRNINTREPALFWKVARRMLGFMALMILLIAGLLYWLKPQYEGVEKEWSQQQPKEGNNKGSGMTHNDGSGTTTNQGMGLSAFNNKANKDSVVFVAKLDNFFVDGKTPNPLYFITDYYSKFDIETQTFEVDSLRPFNDLFSPDVSQIPLFFTKQDTSVLYSATNGKMRRTATVEVYKKQLSARLFTAPSTAYFVQPISVPDENKDVYRSAYRAKMMVSELNSAYFVYNPAGAQWLEQFQEERFRILREAPDYSQTNPAFMQYYTSMPYGEEYDSIRALAASIVTETGANTTVDKAIAIRDFFMRKDENGQPTFKYSDNPGVPGIPSANKLTYFLFDNKKGYCAYYAGATLFLLRSLGIPSRIATGFMTIDRSNKNPGWYWFYEDQAHAWVQVYFPGYGWIDFDTTVPDAEQQQAPQPDQTPPLATQTAWLVANGTVVSKDTAAKKVTMQLEKMLYWDQPYELKPTQPWLMDVSMAKITHDTGVVNLSALEKGQQIVAVSYANTFKEIEPTEVDNAITLLQRFPTPAPIDEIKIMLTEEEKAALDKQAVPETPTDWNAVWRNLAIGTMAFIILLLALPWLIFQYLRMRAATAGKPATQQYWRYLSMMYYLHQMGIEKTGLSPVQFARQQVDAQFGTQLESFMQVYQKLKYSKQPLNSRDLEIAAACYPATIHTVSKQLPFKHRFSHMLNLRRSISFFSKPSLYAS